MNARPLQVLVVDDSAIVREALALVLGGAGDIRVTSAADPVIARRKIAVARPDVIVLDLVMPREDGLHFLREQMATDPIPVVICSAHGAHGSQAALTALDLGAIEIVEKPTLGVREFLHESGTLLVDAVRAAAGARRVSRRATVPAPTPSLIPMRAPTLAQPASDSIVAIAASTGGPPALEQVLRAMPADAPGIVVVQHMPGGFTGAFAKHLDAACDIEVHEAADGDMVRRGCALIAPGGRHLLVHRDVGGFVVEVASGPLVSRHRPSADVLFRSTARAAGPDAVGVLLTGMGDDGAAGLLAMKQAGAPTLAQDEASCVVFGMPRAAIALGAAADVLSLDDMAAGILRRARP